MALRTREGQRSAPAHMTHERGHKDASHDVRACLHVHWVCFTLGFEMRWLLYWSEAPLLHITAMFPCKRAAHSGFIDTKCGL